MTNPPDPAAQMPEDRKAFEQWYSDNSPSHPILTRRAEKYNSSYTEFAWKLWKAASLAALRKDAENDRHDSDCATHNMPAYPNGPCDCSQRPPAVPDGVITQSILDHLDSARHFRGDDYYEIQGFRLRKVKDFLRALLKAAAPEQGSAGE